MAVRYKIEAPCYLKPVFVSWREGVDVQAAAKDLSDLILELLRELKDSIDPYAEDGIEYLQGYAEEIKTWAPKLPGDDAMQHVTRVFCVLRGIHEEIDRITDPTINGLVQQIRGKTQSVVEKFPGP